MGNRCRRHRRRFPVNSSTVFSILNLNHKEQGHEQGPREQEGNQEETQQDAQGKTRRKEGEEGHPRLTRLSRVTAGRLLCWWWSLSGPAVSEIFPFMRSRRLPYCYLRA